MSRLDEPVDQWAVRFAARLTVAAHQRGQRCCLECPGDGCRQLVWAEQELAAKETPG